MHGTERSAIAASFGMGELIPEPHAACRSARGNNPAALPGHSGRASGPNNAASTCVCRLDHRSDHATEETGVDRAFRPPRTIDLAQVGLKPC